MSTATIKLPGGLDAIVDWQPGATEGEIWADAEWQRNNPPGSDGHFTAEARADYASGSDDYVTWHWQPMSERDKSPPGYGPAFTHTRRDEMAYTMDNTEGYDAADLAALNAAWQQITSHGAPSDDGDIAVKSMLDNWSEQLLAAYDSGKRGDALTAWFYAR